MKKVVSFSGGRTSAYLCYLMKERYGDEVDFIYMDTGAEHPKTYEFIRNVNREFNLNLTCLRTDFDTPLGKGNSYHIVDIDDIKPDLKPLSEMTSKYGVPYIGGMFCTDRMKLVPFTKYCQEKYGRGNFETWLGIRADEPARVFGSKLYKSLKEIIALDDEDLIKMYSTNHIDREGFFVMEECIEVELFNEICRRKTSGIRYMAEISEFKREDVLDFWSKMPFDLDIPEHLGNCVFCPKKSNLKLAAAQRDEPEFYHNFLEMIYSDSVRHDEKTGHWSKMYRGKQSLESLIATFDGSTGDEIKARMRGAKMTDAGSCSESCEVFVCESNQINLFGD
ncbi:hypothetical protein NVP1131O_58 [Vibrio phage 1.131.O._10N.222.49.A8]|nr:hypothetical protein NVP1131O_58 [Vibrio phage 1.131.O._10N.222.49.A8]